MPQELQQGIKQEVKCVIRLEAQQAYLSSTIHSRQRTVAEAELRGYLKILRLEEPRASIENE